MQDFFLEVQGQKNALNLLSELYNKKRIPHAFLFSGIEGCGKFKTAVQFLKLLNESTPQNFAKIDRLSEPFVKLIMPLPRGRNEMNTDSPTEKLTQDSIDEINHQIVLKAENPYHKIEIRNANNIKINSIREINKLISLNYDEIKIRGIIVNEAHKMTAEAQNAFLKNLEEPPEGIIYFLITDQPDHLLDTIKSRCWQINFNPLNDPDLKEILKRDFKFSAEETDLVLPFSHGSVTKAFFLKENNINSYLHKTILILRYSLARKYHTALKEFNDIVSNNSVEAFEIIIDLIISWFNDTLKYKFKSGNIDFKDYEDTLHKFNTRFSNADLTRITSNLIELRNAPKKNVALNLITLNVIFELSSIGI